MSDLVSSTNSPGDYPELDEIVEAFENAWNQQGDAAVGQFLPPESHPEFESIGLELLCVDLERRHKAGRRKELAAYQAEFPALLASHDVLERLAFEDYRLQMADGERRSPQEYSRRYQIRTEHWPTASPLGAEPNPSTPEAEACDAVARSGLSGSVADEMGRLVETTHDFPEPGDRFLNFDIVQRLGECKFGGVYLATQADLASRRVVIKLTSNLWCESERLARLQHTNIVPIYSVHQHQGLQAVCMPYLGRSTLATLLEQCAELPFSSSADLLDVWLGSLPQARHDVSILQPPRKHLRYLASLSYEKLCTWLVASIATGLCHAHDRGILHRDLKPANILLTDDGQPMILDFNLSADVVAGGRATLLIGGTLPYMAPEQLRAVIAGGNVDERSDLYSLGVILFEILTGELPVATEGGSIIGRLSSLMSDRDGQRPSVRSRGAYSSDIESIVQRCLAADPAERYQTAHQLREDLDRHLHDLPLKHAPRRSAWEGVQKWARRHPRTTSSTAIGACAAAVLATILIAFTWRGHELARRDAVDRFDQFQSEVDELLPSLSLAISDPDRLQAHLAKASTTLARYDPDTLKSDVRRLDEVRRRELETALPRLHFVIAGLLRKQAEFAPDGGRDALAMALDHHRQGRSGLRKDSRGWLLQEAAIESGLGHERKASQIRQRAEQLPTEDRESQVLVAIQRMQEHEYVAALEILKSLPPTYFTWMLRGNGHYGLGDYEAAQECFTACVALWPDFSPGHFHRGMSHLAQDRFVEAEADFAAVLRLHADHAEALVNRGLARLEQQRHREAATDFEQAIRIRSEPRVWFLLARAYDPLDADQAAASRQRGRNAEPRLAEDWIQLALDTARTDKARAVELLDDALELAPRSRKALQNKAAWLSQLQRYDESLDCLSQLVTIVPREATFWFGRGLLHAQRGDRDQAIADGQEGLRWGNRALHQYQMARIFAVTSRVEAADAVEAARCIREALRQDSGMVEVLRRDADLRVILSRDDVVDEMRAAELLQGRRPTQPRTRKRRLSF